MKKFYLIILLIVTLFFNVYPQNAVDYLYQSLLKAGIVKAIATAYRFPLNTTSLVGIFLDNGKSSAVNFDLKAYTDYAIIGVADEDVEDLDLRLLTADGIELSKDTETNNIPIIKYYNRYAGNKTVEIKNYKARTTSFCLLLILELGDDHYNSIEKFGQAIRNTIDLNDIYNKYTSNGIFLQNTFCLFGGIFESGKSDYFGNFEVPYSCHCMFMNSGSNNISDADLKISVQEKINDMNNIRTICEDRNSDKVAFVPSCYLSGFSAYKLEYINYKSSGDGFLISTILGLK